ncbi:MAG: hypothetical protein LRZ85_02480 [Alphaproteobacteria bacterium]|nr:hypothetical protein [Alphaproteobacteria bacterium]
MLNIPQHVSGITHPLISDMYLKKDFGRGPHHEDVLVIETRRTPANDSGVGRFEDYLAALLPDLEDLKEQAERKVGHIDRIDIKTH